MVRKAHRRERDHTIDIGKFTALTQKTVSKQDRAIASFMDWVLSSGANLSVGQLCSAPVVLSQLLAQYGRYLYRTNQPQYIFSFLITGFQHVDPSLRHQLPHAWSVAKQWAFLEPTSHRAPIPPALFHAIFVVAYLLKWFRFCVILALGYFGPARIGECLQSNREHVILPSDLLFEPYDRVMVHIHNPKSALRGGARHQHFTVVGEWLVRFISRHLAPLAPQARLWDGSPHTFRRRWDAVLIMLAIPPSAGFLPGGLRGGGAVHAYFQGVPISDILWKMRLRGQNSLEHYLQEVAAMRSLQHLPPTARERIRAFARLFPIVQALECSAPLEGVPKP